MLFASTFSMINKKVFRELVARYGFEIKPRALRGKFFLVFELYLSYLRYNLITKNPNPIRFGGA